MIDTWLETIRQSVSILEEEAWPDGADSPAERAYGVLSEYLQAVDRADAFYKGRVFTWHGLHVQVITTTGNHKRAFVLRLADPDRKPFMVNTAELREITIEEEKQHA